MRSLKPSISPVLFILAAVFFYLAVSAGGPPPPPRGERAQWCQHDENLVLLLERRPGDLSNQQVKAAEWVDHDVFMVYRCPDGVLWVPPIQFVEGRK